MLKPLFAVELRMSFAICNLYGHRWMVTISPFANGIEHHCMSLLLQIMNLLFSNSILKMGIYATIGDVLLLGPTMIDEAIICKHPIISMIVLHYHTACFGHPLKTLLAFDSFITGQHSLEMDICEP